MNFARDKLKEFSNAIRAYKFLQIKQGGATILFKLPLPTLQVHLLGTRQQRWHEWASWQLLRFTCYLQYIWAQGPQQTHRLRWHGLESLSWITESESSNSKSIIPPNVILWFISVLHISPTLLIAGGLESPPTFFLIGKYSSETYCLTKRLKNHSMTFWSSVEGKPDPKCSWHVLVKTDLFIKSARKLYKVQQINHENLKLNEGSILTVTLNSLISI